MGRPRFPLLRAGANIRPSVILLEFAVQGVRGVSLAGSRATLRPGYNVVAADGPALRRVLEALLYPDPRDGESIPRASGGPGGGLVRAGLTLVGDDRVTYRLLRDVGGAAQLHRFDPERRAFALVSQDLDGIAAFLRGGVGVPAPSQAALFTLSAGELPSRHAAGVAAPPRSALSPEQARARLAQLEGELARARVVEKLQHDLDALQSQAFAHDEALRRGAELRELVAQAEAARAGLEPVAQAAAPLRNPRARLAAYERSTARRDEVAARLEAERLALAEDEARGIPEPFWRVPAFWAGIAGGALVALAGFASPPASGLRYLALLDIPAFGLAAWVALRWISGTEDRERLTRRRQLLDELERRADGQLERDASDVRAALSTLGLARAGELRDALERLAEADAAVAEARGALAAWEAAPEARRATEQRARLDGEREALEARLAAEAAGFVRDARTVEQELQRLQAEASAPAEAASAPAPAAAAGDPLEGLLSAAGTALGGGATAAAHALAARASQALAELSFQRLGPIQVDDRGRLLVGAGARAGPAALLPPGDRDLLFLSVKLAALEKALAGGRRLAIVDGAFDALPEGARRFAARFLKQVARSGQIVHGTSDPHFREAADHAV